MSAIPAVQHHAALRKFSAIVEGGEAYLLYHPAGDGVLDYASTFVPERLRGRGIAGEVVRQALEYAREGGYKVVPSCWFVKRYTEHHPEYRDLIAGRSVRGEG